MNLIFVISSHHVSSGLSKACSINPKCFCRSKSVFSISWGSLEPDEIGFVCGDLGGDDGLESERSRTDWLAGDKDKVSMVGGR